ncbi:hypothetical protein KKI93_26010, partial [Xenorhabdus bovienii]|uniref:aconitase family protein n=1 Tax=Xenorhabdus bovienii TaxID=40576 RepID=UPI0023B3555A
GDEPIFTSSLELDMSTVEASLAGPKRPQDRVALGNVPQAFQSAMELDIHKNLERSSTVSVVLDNQSFSLQDGAVVIAAITSCTNTS